MRWMDFLPFLMFGESVAAAIIYACNGEWVKAWYWFSGASITLSVLKMQNIV